MDQNSQIIVTKEAGEVLQHHIRNYLTIMAGSLLSLKKRNDKEICRLESQIRKIEEMMRKLSF